jgi:hypothetical protein
MGIRKGYRGGASKRFLLWAGRALSAAIPYITMVNKYPDYRLIVIDALTYAGDVGNILPEMRNSDRFEFWYGDINNLDLVSDLVGRSDVVAHFDAEKMTTIAFCGRVVDRCTDGQISRKVNHGKRRFV